jgi:hypothetical protein
MVRYRFMASGLRWRCDPVQVEGPASRPSRRHREDLDPRTTPRDDGTDAAWIIF